MIDEIKSPRQPQQRIRVTFQNGESICYRHAKDTVLEVLRRIDPNKYEDIKLESKGERIITNNVSKENEKFKLPICEGWWYIKKGGVDTENMVLHLIKINRVLSLGLKIEHGIDLRVTNIAEKDKRSARPKKKIKVYLDDKTFDHESYLVVYRDFVDYVGVDKIAQRKTLSWHNEPWVTTTNMYNSSNRAKLGEFKWFVEPRNSKEAYQMIDLIARHCRLTCEIEWY